MKIELFLFLFFLLPFVSSLQITEIELNPLGNDKGFEWIEFYSEDEVDLSLYRIVNNDGDEILLDSNFSGYFVYIFESQWLDNKNEKVFLYKSDELIDSTAILDDSKNDEFTWQFCDEWKFLNETKGKGDCYREKEENNIKTKRENKKEVVEEKVIKLNFPQQKTIKTDSNTEEIGKSNYAIYGFTLFSVLIVFLFFRKRNIYKNEFGK